MSRRLWIALAGLVAAAPLAASGTAVAGSDRAVVLPPPGVAVEGYANDGYSLVVRDGVATVEVSLEPLASREPFALRPPQGRDGGDELATLARALVAAARTRHEAVSRVLEWVARSIDYDADRSRSQEALPVLVRRSAFCTGAARLSVALLGAVGISAREVPGWVARERGGEYHRWIEVHYPERGWVFSDPLRSHHFVPASYLRLASEALDRSAGERGVLLARENRLVPVDVYPQAPDRVLARRNGGERVRAALRVRVEGREGILVLEGPGTRRSLPVGDGEADFLGIDPGEYRLRWLVAERVTAAKRLFFRGPVRAEVMLAGRSEPAGRGESR